jgi:hypothetical protein
MDAMGLEAECSVRVGRKTSEGKALLEGDVLLFRGDLPLKIPFDAIREVTAEGPNLVVKTADQEAVFEVGPAVAERWVRLIKEPKGLFEKLEVGPQSRVAVVDIVDPLFLTALRERTAGVAEGRVPEGAPVVFFGAETRDALRRIPLLRARMMESGTIWIVRPKGSPAITEAEVMEAAKLSGLVDVKVVAFSKTHTAHKCVVPLELRGQPVPKRPPVVSIPPSTPDLAPKKSPALASAKPAKSASGGTKPGKSVAAKPLPKTKAKPAPKKAAAAKKAPKVAGKGKSKGKK